MGHSSGSDVLAGSADHRLLLFPPEYLPSPVRTHNSTPVHAQYPQIVRSLRCNHSLGRAHWPLPSAQGSRVHVFIQHFPRACIRAEPTVGHESFSGPDRAQRIGRRRCSVERSAAVACGMLQLNHDIGTADVMSLPSAYCSRCLSPQR